MKEITEFTDLWFKDCFHMSLIPAVNHAIGNAECLMFNQLYFFKYVNNVISIDIKEFNSIYDIMTEKKIDNMPFFTIYDIWEFVEWAFRTKHYVVVGVDNYYEPMRLDTFMKKHQGHSFLVYKVNSDKTINVFEQPFFFSNDYKKYKMDYKTLIQCYESYREHRDDENFFNKPLTDACCINSKQPSACIISSRRCKQEKIDMEARKLYLKNMKNEMDMLVNSINAIKLFSLEFDRIYLESKMNKEKLELIEGINEIIISKKVELYLFKKLFSSNHLIDKQKRNIDSWNQVRVILAKRIYTEKDNIESIKQCKKMLDEIYQNELMILQMF